MAGPAPYPLLLRPSYKDYIWGGGKIRSAYFPDAPEGVLAEAWLVSDREDGPCTVRNGPWAGKSLRQVLDDWKEEMTGTPLERFPLLVKILDAAQTLSVQVHPHDGNAAALQGEPKTEMWQILQADPDAAVYLGFNRDVVEDEVRAAIAAGQLEKLLTRHPVKAGETIFVPGGTVHAIAAGCLILEVQQNSNTTYRLFDWNRTGADGKPRPLHIEEGVRAMSKGKTASSSLPTPHVLHQDRNWKETVLLDCPWFRMQRIQGQCGQGKSFPVASMEILFCSAGSLRLHAPGTHEALQPGDAVLIPAGMTDYRIQTVGGDADWYRIFPGKN